MSSLLDRYIYAVERHLPKGAQRQDIGEELRETIQSRIDEETAARGRDLTEAEQAAILKSIGRPVVVASRYGTAQYLVGPSLYPYYVATLKTLATIGLPLLVIGMVVGALGADNPLVGALRAVGRSINAAWIAFGVVTFIFWQMGRVTPKPNFDGEWEPTHLPQLPVEEPRAVPRAASISHAAFLAVYLLWWVGAAAAAAAAVGLVHGEVCAGAGAGVAGRLSGDHAAPRVPAAAAARQHLASSRVQMAAGAAHGRRRRGAGRHLLPAPGQRTRDHAGEWPLGRPARCDQRRDKAGPAGPGRA